MTHYSMAAKNMDRMIEVFGGTMSWSLEQVLALTQIQATLAVAEAIYATGKK